MTVTRLNPVYATAKVGDYYTADWSASSSSALFTQLTNKTVTLPAGTYLVTAWYPNTSTNFWASLKGSSDSTSMYMYGGTLTHASWVVNVAEGGQLYLQSEQSGSVTFSNLDRGKLRATRLK